MNKLLFGALSLFFAAAAGAKDFDNITAECIGLDISGTQRCMDIIARYQFAPIHKMRDLTLAEKRAINAIMRADPNAVMVLLPDGSIEIGKADKNRLVTIACTSLASCEWLAGKSKKKCVDVPPPPLGFKLDGPLPPCKPSSSDPR